MIRTTLKTVAILAITASLAACGQRNQSPASMGSGAPASGAQLSGAGATFPAPLYQAWAQDYQGATGVRVSYQGIGSGGGIKQIEAGTVDFGGSDKPLKDDDLDKNRLMQFPTVIGGVVPVVNLPGVAAGQMKLSGAVLADIFSGKVKMWNDPAIASLNPGVTLPRLPISVVHRSDGSGTTFQFTSYLSAVSPGWKAGPGASDSIAWPVGIGGKGNDGVSAFVRQTVGSIGYVEYAYAVQNKAAYVNLQNHDGQFVAPTAAAFAASAAGADWTRNPGFYLLLVDQPGAQTWPISGATFILVRKDADAAKRQEVLKFADWFYRNGDADAAKLNYVPLPETVKALVRTSWGADAPK
jgi:phosphate transport system substrate-binding protein